MSFHTQHHRFYCGGDLHARTLYLHVLDQEGQNRFEQNLPARPDADRRTCNFTTDHSLTLGFCQESAPVRRPRY
jgi:hypothetical protein